VDIHRYKTAFASIIALAVLLYAIPGTTGAQMDTVINGLQKRYEKITTYKVKFHQTLTSPVFKKVIREADGVIYYAKPGKIRWEYKKPEKRLYLMDGEFFWDYDPSSKLVMKVPMNDALAGDVPHGFLFGAGNLKKDFKLKPLAKSDESQSKTYSVSLVPKDKDLRSVLSDLVLVISTEDYSVVGSSFTDAQGNVNEYTFSDIVINPELDPELFRFKIPHGAKVILPITESEQKANP